MNLTWTGTDVLFQLQYPPYIRFRFKVKIFFERIIARLIQPFIEIHIAVSEGLKKELESIGYKNIIVRPDPVKYGALEKVEHEGFNVLYYIPKGKKNQKFIEWLYGWDMWLEYQRSVEGTERGHKFIEVHGDADMSKIYPIVDFYFRPTRHDGDPMMVRECKLNNIPYYWRCEDVQNR